VFSDLVCQCACSVRADSELAPYCIGGNRALVYAPVIGVEPEDFIARLQAG
jgi:hypothetical protein